MTSHDRVKNFFSAPGRWLKVPGNRTRATVAAFTFCTFAGIGGVLSWDANHRISEPLAVQQTEQMTWALTEKAESCARTAHSAPTLPITQQYAEQKAAMIRCITAQTPAEAIRSQAAIAKNAEDDKSTLALFMLVLTGVGATLAGNYLYNTSPKRRQPARAAGTRGPN